MALVKSFVYYSNLNTFSMYDIILLEVCRLIGHLSVG